MSKKGLYKFYFDAYRAGSLEGIFIATDEEVKTLIESEIEVYFGEVLGKHSEVYGAIDADEITLISDSEEVVKVFEENKISSGYNPFEYTAINLEIDGMSEEDLEDMKVIDAVRLIIKAKNSL